MRKIITVLIILFCLSFVSAAFAEESTINCHCFTDRSFDHQNPEKVVPYLLATTQNSFLSVAFNTPKFKLVKDLMGGVPSDQLWISNYLAEKFNYDIKSLMLIRQEKGNWSETLQETELTVKTLSPSFIAALQSADDKKLARVVVDEALINLMGVDAGQLRRMRTAGADNRELILGFFIALRAKGDAIDIYNSVESGATNWGTLAYINNLQINEMEQEFKKLLR